MTKNTIRATITVEIECGSDDYNDYMNNGSKLDTKLKQVIADATFLDRYTEGGIQLKRTGMPIIKEMI